MELFYRKYRLTIGDPNKTGLLLEELNISFDIVKSADEKLNKAFVSIYNLSEEKRNRITQDSVATLEVAYGDAPFRILFAGDVADLSTTKQGNDVVTEVSLIDGYVEAREGFTSRSYPPNTSLSTVVSDIVTKDMGLPAPTLYRVTQSAISTTSVESAFQGSVVGDIAYPVKGVDKKYQRGQSFHGQSSKVLTDLCNANGLNWFIRNKSVVVVLPLGQSTTESVQLISPDSGLIGTPEKHLARPNAKTTKTKAIGGYKFRSLLNPFVEPGNSLKLEATEINQVVKILKLRHKGELYGNDWITEYETEVVDG
jgi:hypothetical protein